MKKLLTLLLTCAVMISTIVLPVSANGIYYPCYEGIWKTNENTCSLEIYNIEGNKMSFYFKYGEFYVSFYNADIDGNNVYGKYCKDYGNPADGAYILEGNIALNLGDNCIWLIWNGTENGRWFENNFKFTKNDFKYVPIYDIYSNIVLNGQILELPQNPIMMNDRILVPIRAIAESLGAEVIYNEGARKVGTYVDVIKNNKSITFFLTDTKYNATATPSYMWIYIYGDSDSRTVYLDAPVTLYNGTTMVPVRAISEAFGANVTWDENTQTVNISTETSNKNTNNTAI